VTDLFDVVILGGGSGGYACALRASQLGLKVALIEKDKLGGTCLHRGCIPTKALLHAGEVAHTVRHSKEFGINSSFESVDMPAVNTYKNAVVSRLYKGLQGLVKHRGVTYLEGAGKLISKDTIEVNGQKIQGKNIVLATGSYSKSLPGLNVDGVKVLSSEHALELNSVPAKVVILGGGVIGVEFAAAWNSLGSEVTIVEGLPNLIPAEDIDMSKGLEKAFRKLGIKFLTSVRFKSVDTSGAGVKVLLEDGTELDADLLLVAVGRGPTSRGMGYEEVGITYAGEHIAVDEFCRTNLQNVFAVGDLIPGPQLAHVGFQEGILVAEFIQGLNPRSIDYLGVPRVTYCEPEVASMGLTEAQAAAKFGAANISVVKYDLAGNGKTQILKSAGLIKIIRENGGPVIGIHMVGSRAGEMIAEAQLIYNWEAMPEDVAPLLHAHPTVSEAMGEAHLALAGKPLHAHD
jgi:dihydrolipoamide dehydrogenase